MSTIRLLVAAALVAATVGLTASVNKPAVSAAGTVTVPYTVESWHGQDAGPLDEATEALAADLILNRTYKDTDGREADLYVAYYSQQRPGVSIHSPLHCLPGTGWDVVSNDTIDLNLGGTPQHVRRLIAQKGSSRVMVLYWYSISGQIIASELASRVQLLSNRIRLGRNDAALVRIAVPVMDTDDAAAESLGISFVRALVPHLL
jgi:EpsI family protein